MGRKTLIGLLIVVAVMAAGVYLGLGGVTGETEISADEAVAQSIQENSLIFLDDGLSTVNEGQDLVFKIVVDFPAWVANLTEAEKKSMTPEQLQERMRRFLGREFYITGYLAGGKKQGKWYLTKPNYKVRFTDLILSDGQMTQKATLEIPAKVPQGVVLDDNKLISNVFLFERKLTRRGFIYREQWVKIAEASDTDSIDYAKSLADVKIVAFTSTKNHLNTSLDNEKKTKFTIVYGNAGKKIASDVKLKLRLPENTFKVPEVTTQELPGPTVTKETIEGKTYDVLVWNFGNLEPREYEKLQTAELEALSQTTASLQVVPHVEISTSSTDPALANNRQEINLVIISSQPITR